MLTRKFNLEFGLSKVGIFSFLRASLVVLIKDIT